MNNKALVAIAIMLVFVVPIGLGFLLNMEDVEQRSIVENNVVDITPNLVNGDATTSVRYTGANNNDAMYATIHRSGLDLPYTGSLNFVEVSDKPSSSPMFAIAYDFDLIHLGDAADNTGGSDTLYIEIPETAGLMYGLTLWSSEYIRLTSFDGTVTIIDGSIPTPYQYRVWVTTSWVMIFYLDGVSVQDLTNYYNIEKVEIGISAGHNDSNQDIYIRDPDPDSYGQPAYGWTTGMDHKVGGMTVSIVSPVTWFNGFTNTSISFMVDLGAAGTAHTITIGNLTIDQASTGTVTYGLGNTDNTLGKYRYLNVVYDFNTFTDEYNNVAWAIKGISGWPAMGDSPKVMTSHTLKEHAASPITFIDISDTTNTAIFRVDSSMIRDSSLNIINNNSYDPKDKYPTTTGYSIIIDDAISLGSSITFAGHTYTITDGQITVNGIKYDVVGSKFTSIYDADTSRWNNLINGSSIGSSASNGTITFNGISSMEVSQLTAGYHVDTKSTQWVPGHFAFNVSDYALIGLITSIAAFVILGMAGIRSGGKVLWLAAICGGAAIIFITLI